MKRFSIILAGVSLAVNWPASGAAKVDFAKDIQPILQQTCVKCHGPEKQKGKLRLDSREAALKGGKDGPVLTAGDAEKSELYRRIVLPKGNDDIMPNEGDPLTSAQTDLIRDWINQGAVWPDAVVARASATVPGPTLPADFKPGPAEQKAIAALAQQGVEVRPIAMNTVWHEVNFRLQGTNTTDTGIAPVKDIVSLVGVNLGTTKVTDAGLVHLKNLTNLMRLYLELTPVSDSGLVNLKGLHNLTYLNLYGTKISDAGLEHLKGLKYLRNLYLWQTKVTDAGVKKLKAALPNLEVSTGWDFTPVVKNEEKKEEKKDEKKEEKKEAKKEEKKDDKK
jgi:mono/diheme cytochrome c family protein